MCDFNFSYLTATQSTGQTTDAETTASWMTTAPPNCPNKENYSPCSCSKDQDAPDGLSSVYCYGVPMEDIRQMFNRTSPADLYILNLRNDYRFDAMEIPSDFLVNKRPQFITLNCNTKGQALNVDPAAFSFSKNYTTRLVLRSCDLAQTNWSFLTGFGNLSDIFFETSADPHKTLSTTLPDLPSLSRMWFSECSGLEGWTTFPNLTRGLAEFVLANNLKPIDIGNGTSNSSLSITGLLTSILQPLSNLLERWAPSFLTAKIELNDEHVSRILGWVQQSSSSTLERLLLTEDYQSKIPKEISAFTKLVSFSMSAYGSDEIGGVQLTSGSLSFASPPQMVQLDFGIKKIEPNSFKGDFSRCAVDLSDTNLTRLEAPVFQAMLEQMTSTLVNGTTVGYLDIEKSKTCHFYSFKTEICKSLCI